MNELTVNGKQNFMGKEIPVVLGGFGEGKKCICDKTIAEIHNQPVPEIRRRINDNISRFRENVDFIDLKVIVQNDNNNVMGESHDNFLSDLGYTQMQISKAEHIYLLSERGYAKLIKIMDTDLAWEIHDRLIDEYFAMREIVNSDEQIKSKLLLQIYNGGTQGVIAAKELAAIEIKEATEPLKEEIGHKEDVIIGLVDDISLAEKRQILNRVVRYNHANYQERWALLYREFENKYHIDLQKRLDNYNRDNKPKCKNKLDYIDRIMNKIPELYEIATKLFENDIKALIDEMYQAATA